MNEIKIIRAEQTERYTAGIMVVNGVVKYYTMEPPWGDNKPFISCIPTGQYKGSLYFSKKYNCVCIALHDVPGRKYISGHYGNFVEDTRGCILVGADLITLNGRRMVTSSKQTLRRLVSELPNDFTITVTEA